MGQGILGAVMSKSFTVKRGTHGLGLFSNVPFKKGDLVIEYTGEKITLDEANRRGGQYLFEINDSWLVFLSMPSEQSNLVRN